MDFYSNTFIEDFTKYLLSKNIDDKYDIIIFIKLKCGNIDLRVAHNRIIYKKLLKNYYASCNNNKK